MTAPYTPIRCELHDVLESLATTRRMESILFRNEQGALQFRTAQVTDVFTREGEEYVVLDTGESLRLDRLVAVGNTLFVDPAEPPASA